MKSSLLVALVAASLLACTSSNFTQPVLFVGTPR
jgi:hypothetical protein